MFEPLRFDCNSQDFLEYQSVIRPLSSGMMHSCCIPLFTNQIYFISCWRSISSKFEVTYNRNTSEITPSLSIRLSCMSMVDYCRGSAWCQSVRYFFSYDCWPRIFHLILMQHTIVTLSEMNPSNWQDISPRFIVRAHACARRLHTLFIWLPTFRLILRQHAVEFQLSLTEYKGAISFHDTTACWLKIKWNNVRG